MVFDINIDNLIFCNLFLHYQREDWCRTVVINNNTGEKYR